jgi:predicted nicotinamide N-methyase
MPPYCSKANTVRYAIVFLMLAVLQVVQRAGSPRCIRVTTNNVIRSIASITKISTPHGDLIIQEQFTGPPGGATIDTTGRWVWPTAVPLLHRLLDDCAASSSSSLSHSNTVLELGAGCGVLGMGLAASGSFHQVILTDHNTDWLHKNVERNRDLVGDRIQVHKLDWGMEQDARSLEASLVDQQQQRQTTLDWIVGSDILYDPSSHRALVSTLRRFAEPNNASILLAYPRRQDNEEAFVSIAKEHFDIQIEPIKDEMISSTPTTKEYSLARLSLKSS